MDVLILGGESQSAALRRVLVRTGVGVTVARSSEEARLASVDREYVAAVIDLHVDDGGIELAERLLRTGQVGAVVFHCVASDGEELLARASQVGEVYCSDSPATLAAAVLESLRSPPHRSGVMRVALPLSRTRKQTA